MYARGFAFEVLSSCPFLRDVRLYTRVARNESLTKACGERDGPVETLESLAALGSTRRGLPPAIGSQWSKGAYGWIG